MIQDTVALIPGFLKSSYPIAFTEVVLKQLVDGEIDATSSEYPIGCLLN